MTFRRTGRRCAIAGIVAILGGCAPMGVPGSGMGMHTGVPLPGGPLNQLPRATLRGLERQVSWVGCVTAPRTAEPPATRTTIEICAAEYSRTLDSANTSRNGVLTARMINRGPHPDKRWRLSPGDTSFIVSFPRSKAQGGYAILEIPNNSVPGTTVRVVVANGQFIYCGHPEQPTSEASFYTCSQRAALMQRNRSRTSGSGPSVRDGVVEQLDGAAQELDGPAWITCRSGCCTTDAI